MNAEPDASTHWLTLELLSRYAEIAHAGLDAERLYPQVHRHLPLCDSCRSALGDLSHSLDAPGLSPTESMPRHNNWLAVLERPSYVRWAWRPGSYPVSFGLHVSMNAEWLLSAIDRAGAETPPPPGQGVTLAFQWPPTSQEVFQLRLSTSAVPGRHALVVQATHSPLPGGARACLMVGCDAHHAESQDGKLGFGDIVVKEGIERVSLTLESA